MKRLVPAVFGLECLWARMFLEKPWVAQLVNKFVTSTQVLRTMGVQTSVHLDPIYSALKWRQYIPPERQLRTYKSTRCKDPKGYNVKTSFEVFALLGFYAA
jgi:hypothetical protein